MNQQPIYWSNPGLHSLQTTVVDVWDDSDPDVKNRWGIILEATPFYPGGGGQPADEGTISGHIIDAIDNSTPRTCHFILTDTPPEVGGQVECLVEETHRWDYRQQHTGQHLISAIFSNKGISTNSVHMGNAYLGIELEPEPELSLIAHATQECNELISRNIMVKSQVYTRKELKTVKLRSPIKTENSDSVRVVSIQGIDSIGCGGVHLHNTAQLKLILFIGHEKIHGGHRFKWLIGERAVAWATELNNRDFELRHLLQSNSEDVVTQVQRLNANKNKLARMLNLNEAQTGKILAERIIQDKSVAEHVTGSRKLAESILRNLRKSSLERFFLLLEDHETRKLFWFFLDQSGKSNSYTDIFENALLKYHIRGGGKTPQWQGTINGNAVEIISKIRERIGHLRKPD